MAPKGGRGGGGGGRSSGGSLICPSDADYPCTTDMHFMYGHRSTSLFPSSSLYGQIVLYALFALIAILLFLYSLSQKAKGARLIQFSLFLFFAAWVFECTRWGMIIAESSVPIGYRYESSIVVLLWRLAMPALFAAVQTSLQTSKIPKIAFYIGVLAYTILNIAYSVLDFLVSGNAIENFQDDWEWRLSDRDFGLTYSKTQIRRLLSASGGTSGLSPYYVSSRVYNAAGEKYLRDRGIQIKVGVAADFMALALAVYVAAMVGLALFQKRHALRETIIHGVAAFGLLLSTFFRVIVATAFVLPNWRTVTNTDNWVDWILHYYPDYDPSNYTPGILLDPAPEFLKGYRLTVDGFPIIQALFEPLGIILAAAAVVYVAVIRKRTTGQTLHQPVQEQKWGQHY